MSNAGKECTKNTYPPLERRTHPRHAPVWSSKLSFCPQDPWDSNALSRLMLPAITILAAPAKIEAQVIETPSLSWWPCYGRCGHRLHWRQGLIDRTIAYVPLTGWKLRGCVYIYMCVCVSVIFFVLFLSLSLRLICKLSIFLICKSNMNQLSSLTTKLLTLRNWCGSLPRCQHQQVTSLTVLGTTRYPAQLAMPAQVTPGSVATTSETEEGDALDTVPPPHHTPSAITLS